MATSKTTRLLSNLTLQSHRQRSTLAHRLAQHPPTALSLRSRSSSLESRQQIDADGVELLPALARWDAWDRDLDPVRWSRARKILATALVTQISWLVQFASAVDAAVAEGLEAEFGVGPYVSALATGISSDHPHLDSQPSTNNAFAGLFLVGFAFGAPIAGPLSESHGRNPVYVLSLLLFLLTTLVAAFRPLNSLAIFLAARFFAGLFGSTPLVCAGGTIGDLWSPRDQLIAFPLYAAGGISGLAAGPAAGGVMTQALGIERPDMTEWASLAIGVCLFLAILLFQPETYAPVLLKWKTGLINDNMKPEERDLVFPQVPSHTTLSTRANHLLQTILTSFTRPFRLSLHEPIILILSLNLSLLYAIVFTLLPGYILIFTDTYAFGPAARGLAFYGLLAGFLLALIWALLLGRFFRRRHADPNLSTYKAEIPLFYAWAGAPAVPISLFWMGWTARADISPWSPIAASILLGFGILSVFFSSYKYIIHAYGRFAASGLVFITFTRYLLAGVMVVTGIGLFERLGVAWTLTALGTVGVFLLPVPYVLVCYGKKLRMGSTVSAVNQQHET
ncbi:major facilitator superfamily protein [Sarocladium implicatum]|nr:major facilitator superfamily protein [Sarocladium implicatum]